MKRPKERPIDGATLDELDRLRKILNDKEPGYVLSEGEYNFRGRTLAAVADDLIRAARFANAIVDLAERSEEDANMVDFVNEVLDLVDKYRKP